MLQIKNFRSRRYQETILDACIKNNTLVCLPTGTGKTKIAILLAIHQLNKVKDSKVLICSPTKPLTNQIYEEFKRCTDIDHSDIITLTGAVNPQLRKDLWKKSKVIVATPQTVKSDLINNRITLENVSLLCVDEAHKSKANFANTYLAKKYSQQSKSPLILALTASPGGTKEKIDEVCKNLDIEHIEIRTEQESDIKEYIKEKSIEWINVELPENFKKILDIIKERYKSRLTELQKLGFTKPTRLVNKRDLLRYQATLRKGIESGNKTAFWGISLVAQAIKLSHAIDLLETQGTYPLKKYFSRLKEDQSKAARFIISDNSMLKAIELTNKLTDLNIKHPKMNKLCEIVKEQFKHNKDSRIIVFANFRDTVDELVSILNKIQCVNAIRLVGQKEGLSQKEQVRIINEFESGKYNVLVGTSIMEEGLHIGSATIAIFYEPVASEIRTIQRSGRVGRINAGKIIFLITKNTRDGANYWSAHRKAKYMRRTLSSMREPSLKDF